MYYNYHNKWWDFFQNQSPASNGPNKYDYKYLITWCLFFVVHSCSMPLGVEDMRIPGSAFTASGSYDNRHRPSLARLNLLTDGKHIAAWCPKIKSTNQWLQINLGEITAVTKVATQGRYNSEDRVKTYKLSYSVDGIHWTWYKQRAVDKVIRYIPNDMGFRKPKSIEQ